ncbi:MAG: glycosyltransferase family 39 protein [Candidatus Curtissbacteria bacterium]|nr:glycosyltransferase family 39 protein [Candidatus Curtissbacteria bacterium]
MLKNNLLLVIIIALSIALRFYQLGQNPPALDWDETAHGYNAYSLLKTGRDEYGYKLPLSIRSFDDYKPPLYTYLVVPSVAVFGINDFAVRFPSAFLGVLAVFFTYLMVFELFKNKNIALLAALFLAISPWHVQFSRVAFETNSATFWSVLGTWAYLKGMDSKGKKITLWLSLAAIAFGANLYMYHNARVFIPIYSLALVILFRKFIQKNIKYIIPPLLIFAIFIVFLIPIIFSISGQLRFKGTTIFSDVSPQFHASGLIVQDEKAGLGTVGKILHNRRFVYVPILIDNYLSHFRPTFLFITADMERHHAPQIGLLYFWDLPFIVAGIYFLIKNKFVASSKIIVLWWFLISPVAASVTWGVPHSLRSEIFLPTFQIFAAIGVYTLYTYSKRKKLFAILAAITLLANFTFYLHQYYVHMPYDFSKYWLYGRKEAIEYTEANKNKYQQVIVSTKLEQPHEFWLYYSKYDPVKYLSEGGTVSGGFLEDRNKFDKYLFKPIDFAKQNEEAKTLFVGTPKEFPPGVNILKQINYLNGEPAIYIIGND